MRSYLALTLCLFWEPHVTQADEPPPASPLAPRRHITSPRLNAHDATTICHLSASKTRPMTQMPRHASGVARGSDVTARLPTKTVSVQIKLDPRRPGTFNYPKYHQRRPPRFDICGDKWSANKVSGTAVESGEQTPRL